MGAVLCARSQRIQKHGRLCESSEIQRDGNGRLEVCSHCCTATEHAIAIVNRLVHVRLCYRASHHCSYRSIRHAPRGRCMKSSGTAIAEYRYVLFLHCYRACHSDSESSNPCPALLKSKPALQLHINKTRATWSVHEKNYPHHHHESQRIILTKSPPHLERGGCCILIVSSGGCCI